MCKLLVFSHLTMEFENAFGRMTFAMPRSVHGCFRLRTAWNFDAVSLLARAAFHVGLLACCRVLSSSTLASSVDSTRPWVDRTKIWQVLHATAQVDMLQTPIRLSARAQQNVPIDTGTQNLVLSWLKLLPTKKQKFSNICKETLRFNEIRLAFL